MQKGFWIADEGATFEIELAGDTPSTDAAGTPSAAVDETDTEIELAGDKPSTDAAVTPSAAG